MDVGGVGGELNARQRKHGISPKRAKEKKLFVLCGPDETRAVVNKYYYIH